MRQSAHIAPTISMTEYWRKGFSLLEVLIVVAIIGLLLTIVLMNFYTPRQRSLVTAYTRTMQSVRTGLELCSGTGNDTIIAGTRTAGDKICAAATETYPPISGCIARYNVSADTANKDDWSVTTDITCGDCRLLCTVHGCAVAAEETEGACNVK